MKNQKHYDVAIIGGGAAGSSLAIALIQKNPLIKIVIIEKRTSFPQKVGESVNDIAALFFKYGIKVEDIFQKHIQKGGLRFYFDQASSQSIEDLTDLASPSFISRSNGRQLNRSRFDEELLERCRELGIEVVRGHGYKEHTEGQESHIVKLTNDQEIEASWIIDASGRARLISSAKGWCKKHEDLQTSSTWAHFKLKENSNPFHSKTGWTDRAFSQSENATEHFMGKGYWVWKIQIEEDLVSVGIVTDKKFYPLEITNPREHFLSFLSQHPQLKIFLENYEIKKDFHLPHLPHKSHKIIENKIASVGDASGFVDPLFSPGLEYVGNQVLWLCDVISTDLQGKDIKKLSKKYEMTFVESYKDRFKLYEGRYEIMDDPEIFSLWMTFDLVGYYFASVVPSLLFNAFIKRPAQFDLFSRHFYLFFKKMFINLYHQKKKLNIPSRRMSYKTNFYPRVNPYYGFLLFKTIFGSLFSLKMRVLKAHLLKSIKKQNDLVIAGRS